jgi:hypothetical protein
VGGGVYENGKRGVARRASGAARWCMVSGGLTRAEGALPARRGGGHVDLQARTAAVKAPRAHCGEVARDSALPHHWHCLWCTSPLQAKLAWPPVILETRGWRHICCRDPSTVVRTLGFGRRRVVTADIRQG